VTAAISSYNPFELHACENEVVSFTMLDDIEDSDIRGDYTGRIPGLVRPLLKVETKYNN
jgi:lipopolysaccharide transport system ATP-binding protein